MVDLTPTPSFSLTIRLQLPNRAGMLASVTHAIASVGGNLGQIDLVDQTRQTSVRDITVDATCTEHIETIVEAVKALPDVQLLNVYDRTFHLHRGGKISIQSKMLLNSHSDLAMAYTPGVGRICMAIAQDPEQVYNLTIWTPGHSPGSSCLYYAGSGGVLFSGRHLLPNQQGEPVPLRTSKTFHWPRQIRSVQSLIDRFTPATLSYICPGANTGYLRGQRFIDQAYQRLVQIDLESCRQSQALV